MSFDLEKKITTAHIPRASGSTILASDTLNVVYNKYKSTAAIPTDAIRYNLIFSHGTGMNKSIWHYHIKSLFEWSQKSNGKIYIDSVIAIDAAGHGDSGVINRNKLGWIFRWDEGGKDIIEVVRNEHRTTGDFQNNFKSRNILIGHSMGGFLSLLAAFYEPDLFDATVPIEPVVYLDSRSTRKFSQRFLIIGKMIINEFDTKQAFEDFFKVHSFYKNIDPKVMDDFLNDELLEVIDPKTKDVKYRIKSSSQAQMAGYVSSALVLPLGMDIYKHIRVPIAHVIGKNAKWNPPESTEFFRGSVNPDFLAATYDIEGGEHLVNAEKPDDLLEVLKDFILKRKVEFKSTAAQLPEQKAEGLRQKVFESEIPKLLNGDLGTLYGIQHTALAKASKL